ncbi:hypothetical protein [Roseimaritima ulvae]|uniref:Chromosome partition protein Smc n=1 Tax=Roseimaritima ulvae TaxID=980254 RepID=A0A5B9R4J0_9BACT|nr:hypothetical protein [Roseimaritima ulvae]QEG41123.1 hypothetical protein UC8_31420 [Roseimaritima ulvae]
MRTIEDILSKVRRRLWLQRVTRVGTIALAAAAALALLMVVLQWWRPSLSPLWALAIPGLAWLGVTGWATTQRFTLTDAALVVDQYYGMKDRAISAWQFANAAADDPLKQLQVSDTLLHLQKVRPADCVPIAAPRVARNTAVLLGVAAVLGAAVVRLGSSSAVAAAPLPIAAAQADHLRTTVLPEIQRLAEQHDNSDLDALSEKLETLIEQLDQPGVDQRDLLAQLSEMQQALEASREALQLEAHEDQLQAVASAMQPAESLQNAAAALQDGDYDQAAESLKSVEPRSLSDKERRAVADNLKKASESATEKASKEMQQATQQVQEGLEQQDASKTKQGMEKLAEMAKQQAVREQLDQAMASQMNQLAESKAQARGKQGGNQPGDSDSKSNKASDQWGRGTAGTPNEGPATTLDSRRQREQLTGQQADGPRDTETVQADQPDTPEDTQATRAYQERYQKFRNQAEAVLENESLPWGHRHTVRQYFEQIRPQPNDPEGP